MLRIVMDTAGDLAEGWEEEYQIDLIPINIIHQGKTYLQGIELGYEDFYRLVESSDTYPALRSQHLTSLLSSIGRSLNRGTPFFHTCHRKVVRHDGIRASRGRGIERRIHHHPFRLCFRNAQHGHDGKGSPRNGQGRKIH